LATIVDGMLDGIVLGTDHDTVDQTLTGTEIMADVGTVTTTDDGTFDGTDESGK